jgi:hypothetical protein
MRHYPDHGIIRPLVFLDRLERDAEPFAKLGLRQPEHQPAGADARADSNVNRVWRAAFAAPFRHHRAPTIRAWQSP